MYRYRNASVTLDYFLYLTYNNSSNIANNFVDDNVIAIELKIEVIMIKNLQYMPYVCHFLCEIKISIPFLVFQFSVFHSLFFNEMCDIGYTKKIRKNYILSML